MAALVDPDAPDRPAERLPLEVPAVEVQGVAVHEDDRQTRVRRRRPRLVDLQVELHPVVHRQGPRRGPQRAVRRGRLVATQRPPHDRALPEPAGRRPDGEHAEPEARPGTTTHGTWTRGHPGADPRDDLVGDRAERLGPVVGGRLAPVPRTEEHDLVALAHRVVADVEDELVHAHGARDGPATTGDEHRPDVRRRARDPVGVAERHERERRLPVGRRSGAGRTPPGPAGPAWPGPPAP